MSENMTPELTLNPTETEAAVPELTLDPAAVAEAPQEKPVEPVQLDDKLLTRPLYTSPSPRDAHAPRMPPSA